MQHAQCMLIFLVLVGNFAQFRILRSYMLLLKSPVLMCSWYSIWCLASSVVLVKATRDYALA